VILFKASENTHVLFSLMRLMQLVVNVALELVVETMSEQTLNQLLTEMDGLRKIKGNRSWCHKPC
jgi:hypothetical protein